MDIPLHGVHSPGRALSYTDDEIPVPRDVLAGLMIAARECLTTRTTLSEAQTTQVAAASVAAGSLLSEARR
jgi:hypothetical protein